MAHGGRRLEAAGPEEHAAMKYAVIVENIGTVLRSDDWDEVLKTFVEYTKQARDGNTRAGKEVTLTRDGEPWMTFRSLKPD